MNDVMFIVYKYTFDDGKVYIGRTRKDLKRLGNPAEYKDQYVGKMMVQQPNFKIDILLETTNPLVSYDIEKTIIDFYWDVSYNSKREEHWEVSLFKDLQSKKIEYTFEDLAAHLEEYKNEIQRIRETILRQAESGESKN